VPKRQAGNAFFHFASIAVCPLAFFPNPVDLVVVAAQIQGRVNNREEKQTANTAMPIALMRASLPRYAADASSWMAGASLDEPGHDANTSRTFQSS
jgi:hypothetical protein